MAWPAPVRGKNSVKGQNSYFRRIFEHFGVLRDEPDAEAGFVYFWRAAGVREGRVPEDGAFDVGLVRREHC